MQTSADDLHSASDETMNNTPKPSYIPRHAEATPGAEIELRTLPDGGVSVSFSDGSDELRIDRREFMRISGVAAATAAMASAGCRNPVEKIVPYVDRPEEVRIGQGSLYATVWKNTGILVRTRAGRPVKLEGNPKHPTSEGALSARGQASYMDLYDPDRARNAVRVVSSGAHAVMTWDELDREVVARLKGLKAGGGVRILTGTTTGSAQQALIDEIKAAIPSVKHYMYDALGDEAMLAANEASYGKRELPHYRFDKADLVVSLQSDFLGSWLSPVEFARQFSSRRDPDGNMLRFVAFEGMLSQTGSNADDRYRVRLSHLPAVAMALAHEVIVTHGKWSGAGKGDVASKLGAFTPAAVAGITGLPKEIFEALGKELASKVGKSVIVAGGAASNAEYGVELEAAVNLLNHALEADGTIIERHRTSRQSSGQFNQLVELLDEIKAGKVDVLILANTNPAYSAPPELKVGEVFAKVPMFVSCNDRVDETGIHAKFLAAGSHYLEAWGDSVPFEGVYAIQQPAIRPLFDTRAFEESLIQWFGASELVATLKPFLAEPAAPAGNHAGGADFKTGAWYRFLKNHWQTKLYAHGGSAAGDRALASFEDFWEGVLRTGVWESPAWTDEARHERPAFRAAATAGLLPAALPKTKATDPNSSAVGNLAQKEIHLYPSVALGDGEQANNGHLQELPDPITRNAWGPVLMVSPRTFKAANLTNGQIISVKPVGGERALKFAVCMQPGMHDDVVAVALGYGRTGAGAVGDGIGENAYTFSRVTADKRRVLSGFEVGLTATSDSVVLCNPQGSQVIDLEKRTFIASTTLEAYRKDKKAGIHQHPVLEDLWEDHKYTLKWGMAVDLSKCTGCGACTIACQEENNIPVVGRQGVIEGREMHWIRVDRYYKLPDNDELHHARYSPVSDPMFAAEPYVEMSGYLDDPRVVYMPVMCQHCESAPCETVCPVLATMHSSDGLNQMAYNRCVGTRYCANNCPFKVRRFNWYNYSTDRTQEPLLARLYPELHDHARYNVAEPLPMGYNPEVTVRSRGVMEKCTFCVQRIRRGKWQAKREGRTTMRDGDVVPACQQTCASGAITFGNLMDPESDVAKLHAHDRAVEPLGEIGVGSSVRYMTRVVHGTRVDLEAEAKPYSAHGGHGAGHDAKGHDAKHDAKGHDAKGGHETTHGGGH